MPTMKPKRMPRVICLLTCDQVLHDFMPDRYSPINVFATIRAEKFPVVLPTMALFIEFTDGSGWTPLQFRAMHASEEGPPLWDYRHLVEMENPLLVRTLAVEMGSFTFPAPGDYLFQILVADKVLLSRRVTLILQEPMKGLEFPDLPAGG